MKTSSKRTLQFELQARLESAPDDKALTFVDARGRFQWRSFESVYERAAKFGSVLADRGLQSGQSCVLVLPSDENACYAVLACLLVGARPVLVAPPVIRGVHSNLGEVILHVAHKTSSHVLVVGDDAVEIGEKFRERKTGISVVFSPDDLEEGDTDRAPIAFPAGDGIAAYQLTSGTTGFPKICVWRQQGVLASLDGMVAAMDLHADDMFLNWTPLYHDMGLVNNFLLCMVHRVPLAMIETMEFLKRPSLWLRALSVTGANTTWSPNFGFSLAAQRISERELQGVKLDHVRGFWNAAERIHLETMREFHRRFCGYGVTLRALKTNFGCAENVGGATFSDPHGDFVTERVSSRRLYDHGIAEPVGGVVGQENEDAVEIVSVGRPFPGMSIKIFSRNGRELTDGKVGEIALDTPSRMVGYLGDSRETNRAIKDGAVRTGDLGYKRGEEIFWVGRVKERINLHGKKFDPSDFEQALLEVGGLRKGCFAAFGVDDEKTGTQKLVIVSETAKKNPYPDGEIVKGIKEYVAQRVGIGVDEMVLLAHGTMSKTSSGKRRHRFYRQQYIDGKLQSMPGARLFAA